MNSNAESEFYRRFCPHRGVGIENTLQSIKSAIQQKPFLVEFDIQAYNDNLHLGHPPDLNLKSTLAEALDLFIDEDTVPKIDLKLDELTFLNGLESLLNLIQPNPRRVLINIDGELDTEKFMEAETYLLDNTGNNVLLNIDLIRYKNTSKQNIDHHIKNLTRTPFSLSSNIDSNLDEAIDFALEHGIPHLHLWSFFDKQYSLDYLCRLMKKVLDSGLEVYFDMKYENISKVNSLTKIL